MSEKMQVLHARLWELITHTPPGVKRTFVIGNNVYQLSCERLPEEICEPELDRDGWQSTGITGKEMAEMLLGHKLL